ncbi:MAG: ATP-binding protein [Burkholderiaceae bacterium]
MLVISGIYYVLIVRSSQHIIEFDAIRIADVATKQALASRSAFIADRAGFPENVQISVHSDMSGHNGMLLLPSEFLKWAGQEANRDNHGLYQSSSLSKWNLESTQGLNDDFQRWAWAQLELQDSAAPSAPINWQPVWRFERVNDVLTLRYMRADPASNISCVNCHNAMEPSASTVFQRKTANVSTGKQWKLNQLLGAVEADIPLENIESLAANDAQMVLLFGLSVSIMFLLAGAWLAWRDLQYQKQNEMALSEKNAELNLMRNEILGKNHELASIKALQSDQKSELIRFLAVASHDLRQPMHALNLYLVALNNIDMPDSAKPVIENMHQCAQIMNDMFLALLDISRLDAQVVDPCIEPFPVASLLSSIEIEFAPLAKEKGVKFRVATCSAWCQSDPTLLRQILRNFAANAIRYTDSGTILIGCRRKNGLLRLGVYDTGIGIALDQQKFVFDEFCQIGNVSGDPNRRLGLGLAIARRLSQLLSTPITLESEPGKGSMFAVDLPCIQNPQSKVGSDPYHAISASVKPVSQLNELVDKLIVVVDDDECILDAMRILFTQWGCNVVTAKTGTEAIEKSSKKNRRPDAIICDYDLLLNEKGLDVIQSLEDEFNSNIPALIITGNITSDRIDELSSFGVPILHKPVNPANLQEALVRLVAR